MKVIRIILTQTSANYRKEESSELKTTYPLPPISTVIGAIHSACNWKNYHALDISVQGKFDGITKKSYVDYCFFNSLQDDRGILAKVANAKLLSAGHIKVAESIKNGSSFKKQKDVRIYNQQLLDDFTKIQDVKAEFLEFKKTRYKSINEKMKTQKTNLVKQKKLVEKKSPEFEQIQLVEKNLKKRQELFKQKVDEYEKIHILEPLNEYQTFVTSLKGYELLHGIKLIIHVRGEEETLKTILDNAYNITSIGRKEDFVDIEEVSLVDLKNEFDTDKIEPISNYSGYLCYEDVLNNRFITHISSKENLQISGTKYLLNKDYTINEKGKRVFNKHKVIYTSGYSIDEFTDNIWLDENDYIVNFI
ncbi:MAG: hypothetical protein ATN36_05800 [Epulopiscium sp. Nele67-Bin005]|nr:MAG: hypothetical protein ATN36_05800 [Epulopiscium sp. Nele67-Bin005]